MESWNSATEVVAMTLIASAGTAKSLAFEALKAAKQQRVDEARDLLRQANVAIRQAHDAQTGLLQDEAQGQGADLSILLVHAQDHFMTGMLAVEMMTEVVELYIELKGGETS